MSTPRRPTPRPQAAGMSTGIRLLEQAAQLVSIPDAPQPIVIADYGAGTAQNSLQPISAALAVLRRRTRPEHSVLVTHTDVADNDFSTMFRMLAQDQKSYARKDSATFSSAVGQSFFTQILPSNCVHVGWSAWAILRLGQIPMPVPDHVVAARSADDTVRNAYARQAAHDWQEFVAFRGRELSPGGRMVILTMGLGDGGDFGYEPLLDAITATLTDLVAEGVVSGDEVARMTLPIVGRNARDFAAPFAPSGRFERLSIEHQELFDADDKIFDAYRIDRDARTFGTRWADFCWFTVFADLGRAVDGAARRTVFYERLHAGIAVRLATSPEPMRIPIAALVLEKRRLNP